MRKLNLLFQVGKNFVKYFDREKLTEIYFCANTLISWNEAKAFHAFKKAGLKDLKFQFQ